MTDTKSQSPEKEVAVPLAASPAKRKAKKL